MEIKIRGNLPIADLMQALWEELHLVQDENGVQFSRGATLYINPSNELGDDVVPRNSLGHEVKKRSSTGPYRSAADDYKI